jgi:hypothetical protein
MLSNPATLSNPAIVRNSARLSNLAMRSNPATFSNPLTLSNADDVRLTSPSQSEDVHNNNSTPTDSNPLEGKTTALIAVMRRNPKDGYTHLCSNKHCKQKIVRVLLDSGSDGNLTFVNKDKPMLLLYSNRLFPQLWNTSNGIFQWQGQLWQQLWWVVVALTVRLARAVPRAVMVVVGGNIGGSGSGSGEDGGKSVGGCSHGCGRGGGKRNC